MEARRVAVVGASERPDAPSGFVLRNLLACDFSGTVWPVHPSASTVYGWPAVPRLADLPDRPDAVVIAVPAATAVQVVGEAASLGIPGAVVLASGFAETGAAGRALQQALTDAARSGEMALCGPNCLGLHVPATGLALFSSRLVPGMRQGPVAVISHSGATAIALANSGRLGVSHVVSAGNAAVTDVADYLGYFAGQDNVRVVALLLEKVADPAAFALAMAQAHRSGLRVVALRTGRSVRGARTTAAHTGALAGSNEAASAFLHRHGVLEVTDYDELLETAVLLSTVRGRRTGGGIAALGVSGGGLAHCADLAADAGVGFADLAPTTRAELDRLLPPFARADNPLDMTGVVFGEPQRYEQALTRLAADPSVSMLVAVQDVPLGLDAEGAREYSGIAQAIARYRAQGDKPVAVLSLLAGGPHPEVRDILQAADVPVLQCGRAGWAALGHLLRTRTLRLVEPAPWIRQPAWVRRLADGPALTEREAKNFLRDHGIPTTREWLAPDPDSAVRAAQALGWPVVLKIESPDIAHKTEAGGVQLNVRDEAEVRAAFERLVASARRFAPEARIAGVLVQEMVSGGVEVLVGLARHPPFGLGLTVGPGGVFVELTGGHALDLLPLDVDAARELIETTPLHRLLAGYRGGPVSDAAVLCELMQGLSRIGLAYEPYLQAVDLNPVSVLSQGRGVRVLDALIVRHIDEVPAA
ncbi:MAG: acetate--CoA ligase family protein [Rhodoferax sp.]|nr:acetate--CoA ligase family protein [Rhodoferax sp.]